MSVAEIPAIMCSILRHALQHHAPSLRTPVCCDVVIISIRLIMKHVRKMWYTRESHVCAHRKTDAPLIPEASGVTLLRRSDPRI